MQPCTKCGTVYSFEHVPANPFKLCPNPACNAPLTREGVEHTFVEAANPSNPTDPIKVANRDALHAHVSVMDAHPARAVVGSGEPGAPVQPQKLADAAPTA